MELNNDEINSLFNDAIKDIKGLVSIPSYVDESDTSDELPYGKNVHQALDYVINLGNKMGFKTFVGKEKRYGYIEHGTGDELVGILCHLDVVPVGDLAKWKYDPFTPTIDNNILYGRGVIDDKGPAIVNLYALKYLADKQVTFKKRIRLIFGLTEETTWDSINCYLQNEERPKIAYTPDGYFPIVYAEKTILNIDIIEKHSQQKYIVKAGQAYNVTCDEATYYGEDTMQLIAQLAKHNFAFETSNNSIIVKGKAAHGSKPQDGINAGIRLLTAIANVNNDSKLALWVKEVLGEDVHAYKVFNHLEDESGTLTFNVGYVEMNQNKNWIGCDLRIPVHCDVNDIMNKLTTSLTPYNLIVEQKDVKKKLFFDQKSPLVKTLLGVYEKVTGHHQSPIAIGGGTYARSIDNCVAFGAIFNGYTSTEHQYNESVNLDELKLAMKIYIEAIIALDRL